MDDRLLDASDAEALLGEISRLRSEISRLEQRVEMLDRLAHQDSLIELPNRRGFMRQLERLIDRVTRYGDPAALLFVDIDGLKKINDSFGHAAGDEALIQVARALAGGVRRSDCVARLGGDEFGILLEHADETARERRPNGSCRRSPAASSASRALACRSASQSELRKSRPATLPRR